MATNVSEKQAGQSGQAGSKPLSFGRQLFLGDFGLELIHRMANRDSSGDEEPAADERRDRQGAR